MSTTRSAQPIAARRSPLSRSRIVEAAVGLADDSGSAGVTMRAVASSLGVEAMSLYNHVANRAGLLDGMIDAVFAEIALPDSAAPWRDELHVLAVSTRAALQRHPWAIGMMDSRSTPGPATLRHHDSVLGTLRRAGFSTTMSVHAMAVLDSYVYGSLLQERSLPFGENGDADDAGDAGHAAAELLAQLSAADYPNLAEIALERAGAGSAAPGVDDEFLFGLALILDGLAPDAG
ncbi:TetR/AcrR family transcriptional regulator [Agromyces subbeticus]|uniref:TetR/AcrR family transcriptional regulator n=1 Tax=Agromyces subbeticus TaxID=293890 RepID=UPI0003B4769E|nr:TetR/AcrR family transcriptional regulator [Agromyces subbeticus]